MKNQVDETDHKSKLTHLLVWVWEGNTKRLSWNPYFKRRCWVSVKDGPKRAASFRFALKLDKKKKNFKKRLPRNPGSTMLRATSGKKKKHRKKKRKSSYATRDDCKENLTSMA